jgi:hypothetical protein
MIHGIGHGKYGIETAVLTDAKVKAARPRPALSRSFEIVGDAWT